MKLLLDTHVVLWWATYDKNLKPSAVRLIEDPDNELAFSVVNIWEAVVKRSLGRSDFTVNPHVLRASLLGKGLLELPVSGEHALAVGNLPSIHRDPFDRILVAQATVEGCILLTSDPTVASYPGPIRLV